MGKKAEVKILLVEDSEVARMGAMFVIEDAGFYAETAVDDRSAIDLLLKKPYDLVLMDLGLGEGMDGYQIVQKIRSEHGQNKDTIIIALTAYSQDDIIEKCLTSGMQGVITKPLEQKVFENLVEKYVEV